ncbi:MAG: hypothetical protein CRU72_14430 [Candidatus Accumulibacter phosphatis]|nr:hypothetical protein [Candidatus Accumulibacter phosphatis]
MTGAGSCRPAAREREGRPGLPFCASGDATGQADTGIGDEADVDFMESVVGLIWRALLLWLLLFGLANLVGG